MRHRASDRAVCRRGCRAASEVAVCPVGARAAKLTPRAAVCPWGRVDATARSVEQGCQPSCPSACGGRPCEGDCSRRSKDTRPARGADMATQPDENKPTIVLVHGAWADATGFDAEIRALQREGFRAIGFANPLRDLAADSSYLAEFLRMLTGPIVLVGHSYGGNIISVAATGNDQVQALVYLNGWMCDVGESQEELLGRFEGSLVGPSVRPVPFTSADGSEGADLFLAPEAFREAFAADQCCWSSRAGTSALPSRRSQPREREGGRARIRSGSFRRSAQPPACGR